ncbi:hypothetical protein ACFL3S_03535 [Gemmatimonadota bacterium]
MTRIVRYGVTALLAVLLAIAGLWPILSEPARTGVLVAGAVAWPVQLLAFGFLVRFWGKPQRFLLVWVGGTLVRMGAIVLAAILLVRVRELPPAPTLLALAGFFFGLLLLEPLFLRPRKDENIENV